MTRRTPGGSPPEGYQAGGSYGHSQQPQYRGGPPSYDNYSAGEAQNGNQGYQSQSSYGQGNYGQQGYGQPPYGSEDQGQAQSYYGSNDQPYQQYPHDSPGNQQSGNYYQGPPAQTYQPPQEQHQYGFPPPAQNYPPYGQDFTAQHYVQHQSGDVDAFRSHFDHSIPPENVSGHHAPEAGQYPPGPGMPPPAEEDRGVMGALAGGTAGAYGGHKMGHHGILGGIGGAIAGSLLEDAAKKHKKEKKEEEEKLAAAHSSNSGVGHPGYNRAAPEGNFHASSHNVHLEGHCTLVADCKDVDGRHHQSTIDLNDCFTNTNGGLFWARGGNFAASARHIQVTDNGETLEAELNDGRGGWVHNKVWLNERITNDNGRLELL